MDLNQANREAQLKLEEWNRFIENALDRTGYIDTGERQMKLEAWMLAEQRAGNLRKLVRGADHANGNHQR